LPGWRVHQFMEKKFFGKSYRKIHTRMDSAIVLFGRNHRILFHDPITAGLIAAECYPNDPKAVAAANLHIHLDRLCSASPAYKQYLETMAMSERKKRKRNRRRRPEKQDPIVASFFADLKKMEKIKELARTLSQNTGS
jgi:hypothetical protein